MFSNIALIEETDRLRKFAFRLTQNYCQAEDLVQSTVLRAIEKRHMFETGTNLYGWVSKMMFHLFVSKYRRKVKFETQYDPEPYIQAQCEPASQEIQMQFNDTMAAIQGLSQDHRDVLDMVCLQGMAYDDVAQALDIPVGTVRSRLHRARENLLDILGRDKDAPDDALDHIGNISNIGIMFGDKKMTQKAA